ncbi:MAG: ABC transporter permease [Oscillospiraceae bacterium]|jgi:ABC-2 type transport system permease protein|nr:ABC transporter permease [Oscillospiraceae bacterium]
MFKQIKTVASFTIAETLHRKSFWVTTVLFVVLMAALGFFMPMLLQSNADDAGANPTEVQIEESVLQNSFGEGSVCYLLEEGEKQFTDLSALLQGLGYARVEPVADEAAFEAAKAYTAQGNNTVCLRVAPAPDASNPVPVVTLVTKDYINGAIVQAIVQSALDTQYKSETLTKLGLNPEEALKLVSFNVPILMETTGSDPVGSMIFGIALMAIMFFSILFFGSAVATSVAQEKSSRVMETLVVSARPKAILLGKCLGSGIVGLCQMVALLSTAALSLRIFVSDAQRDLFHMPELGLKSILLLLVFFLGGYSLFVMINSACGALVSKMEDLQQASMPAQLIAMASFYGGYIPTAFSAVPGSTASTSTVTMLIPFTAPYAVCGRILNGTEMDTKVIALSLLLLIATIAVCAWFSVKVYTASVLHYGTRLKLSDAWKLSKAEKTARVFD